MADDDPDQTVEVTFHPQEWVDSPGESHDWGRKQLVPASDRDAVTFAVPRADATDEAGTVFPDDSYQANCLQAHPDAPAWVRDWDGPYFVETDG
jgi:hypothetical protein